MTKTIHWRWFNNYTPCGLRTTEHNNVNAVEHKTKVTCKRCIKVLIADGTRNLWKNK